MLKKDSKVYATLFKALSDPFRIDILELLPDRPECDLVLNVNDLVAKMGGSQPNMSHHLKILKQAGLITGKKMCSSIYFYKNKDVFVEIRAFVDALKKNT